MDDSSSGAGFLADENATLALGERCARALRPGTVIYLDGDLGAGKTTFTRGLLRGLGHAGRVKSPTYTLIESYQPADTPIHHFDLYRFNDPEEWEDAGFREHFGPDSICLVEWPQKAQGLLPAANLTLQLTVDGAGRRYRFVAHDEIGIQCLNRLSS